MKWYFKTYVFVIAFLCVGPFALPLVWLNPYISPRKKIVITIITLIVSYCLAILLVNSVKYTYDSYQQLFKGLNFKI